MARTVARDAAGRASPRFSQVSEGKRLESLPSDEGEGRLTSRTLNVSLGSKCEKLAVSITSPVSSQLRT